MLLSTHLLTFSEDTVNAQLAVVLGDRFPLQYKIIRHQPIKKGTQKPSETQEGRFQPILPGDAYYQPQNANTHLVNKNHTVVTSYKISSAKEYGAVYKQNAFQFTSTPVY